MARQARRGIGLLMAAAVLATAFGAPAGALAAIYAEITVNSLSDAVANDGACTLREALTASNTNAASGAAGGECPAGSAVDDELINFAVSGTITLGSDMVATVNALKVDGHDGIVIDANGHRAFNLSGDQVWIQYLAIRNASGTYGGAIATAGHVFVVGVNITASTSSNFGGAIFVGAGGSVLVRESTLSGNHAGSAGGAVYAEGSYIGFLNATLSGNTAPEGSALYSTSGQTEFLHATVSGNTASTGGGAAKVTTGTLNLINSLIIGNTGSNLVSAATTTNRLGSTINRSATGILDPNGLQDNGGTTKTIRLVNSSTNPALNHGNAGYCAETSGLDQRAAPRVAPCDDGAVELDRTKPRITSAPKISFVQDGTAGDSTVKVSLGWLASDTGSGIDRFTLQRQVNGGSWTTVSSTLAPRGIADSSAPSGSFAISGFLSAKGSYLTTLTSGKSYRFRVRARDEDANTSDWAYSLTVGARLAQQSSAAVTYSSGWSSVSNSSFSGNSAKSSTTAGKWARFTFTGRAVAFVSTFRAPGDAFKVYIDGVYERTIAVASGSDLFRRQLYIRKFPGSTQHTIRIVVVSGRVDVDAFAVLR